jgi:hypothetical protein
MMNELVTFLGLLASTLVAFYAGRYVGRRFLRGRISTEGILAVTLVVGFAVGYILIVLFDIPRQYVLGIAIFIGSAGSAILEDPHGIHEWLDKNPGSKAKE